CRNSPPAPVVGQSGLQQPQQHRLGPAALGRPKYVDLLSSQAVKSSSSQQQQQQQPPGGPPPPPMPPPMPQLFNPGSSSSGPAANYNFFVPSSTAD
ncbi:hypothetical protein BOX15_Mlig024021g1, partial [Macrostomum lignano]